MHSNIYLTGFMGSGKTTVGKLLAQKLKREFIDLDQLLVKELGMQIPRFFELHGERKFRAEETKLLNKIAKQRYKVVSTGGGIVESATNRKTIKRSGHNIYLHTTLDECAKRLDKKAVSNRPMWQDRGQTESLFIKRVPLYKENAITVPTDRKSVDTIVGTIIKEIFPDDNFSVNMEGIECPVVCSFRSLEAICAAVVGKKRAILTDKKVAKLHLPRYLGKVDDALVIKLAGGERIKSLSTAQKVYQMLLDNHFNRDDLLIAVGGGTVTDLGAYIASTYKRGMPFILASTTLLGSVDAAVGGKAAVNFGKAKNIIGTFTIPELVVLDVNSFASLAPKQISEGLVEAYKTGLIAVPKLAKLIEGDYNIMLQGDLPLLKEVAAQSAMAKAEVVSGDFREGGRRAILNFGHTYAHAVEGYFEYKVSHGQAVALGLIVATIISKNRKMIDTKTCDHIVKTITRICPDIPDLVPVDEAMEIMAHDKKVRNGKLVFVLLEKYGKPVIVDDIKKKELTIALRETQKCLI